MLRYFLAIKEGFFGNKGIPGLWTQVLDAGLWALESGRWTLDAGRWILDSGL